MKTPLKVCHVVPIFSPGTLFGSAKYVRDLSKSLAEKGHLNTVLTANALTGRGWVDPLFGRYSSIKEERIGTVRVKRLKNRWPLPLTLFLLQKIAGPALPKAIGNLVSLFSAGPYLSNLKKEFRRERYEVVHATPLPYGLVRLAWKACRGSNIPFLCTPFIHFEDPRFKNPLVWEILRDASLVIACSRYEKERMIGMGLAPSRIVLLPMAVYPEEWQGTDGDRFRKRYHLESKRIILFAGPKSYNKGAVHLLRAVQRLQKSRKDFVLVTLGLSTREWKREKNRIEGFPLLDLGYVAEEEKKDAFSACDLLAMPSRYDSFGIVYLEAWKCGKPVIGARVGAISEIIEDGRDGFLVDFGDVNQLVSRIESLLADSGLRKKMGEAGRNKVEEGFNWEKKADMIETIFERTLSRR